MTISWISSYLSGHFFSGSFHGSFICPLSTSSSPVFFPPPLPHLIPYSWASYSIVSGFNYWQNPAQSQHPLSPTSFTWCISIVQWSISMIQDNRHLKPKSHQIYPSNFCLNLPLCDRHRTKCSGTLSHLVLTTIWYGRCYPPHFKSDVTDI